MGILSDIEVDILKQELSDCRERTLKEVVLKMKKSNLYLVKIKEVIDLSEQEICAIYYYQEDCNSRDFIKE